MYSRFDMLSANGFEDFPARNPVRAEPVEA
jgi:hypothetical protein